MAMKILYVAKHGNGYNDDEGAIEFALKKLGHEVKTVNEEYTKNGAWQINKLFGDCDFLLFHKWSDFETIKNVKLKKVFWYFDLVESQDVTLHRRDFGRRQWMKHVLHLTDLGFCTDGDWVNKHPNKLIRLTQGADERVLGFGEGKKTNSILFTGIKNKAGVKRLSFVNEMKQIYKNKFDHRLKHYRKTLADLIARSAIVVAPDFPVTDHYWSNRVYMACGFGAFMLHPYCQTLTADYEHEKEIVYYQNRKELHEYIDYYLDEPEEREKIQQAALEKTKKQHLYKHRINNLINIVKERIL